MAVIISKKRKQEISVNTIEYKHENRFIRHSSVRYIFPPMIGMIFAQIAPLVDGVCVSNSMGENALAASEQSGLLAMYLI